MGRIIAQGLVRSGKATKRARPGPRSSFGVAVPSVGSFHYAEKKPLRYGWRWGKVKRLIEASLQRARLQSSPDWKSQ